MNGGPETVEQPLPEPLVQRPGRLASVLLAGASIMDPVTGLDGTYDLMVEEGRITEIADAGSLTASGDAETVDGNGKFVFRFD